MVKGSVSELLQARGDGRAFQGCTVRKDAAAETHKMARQSNRGQAGFLERVVPDFCHAVGQGNRSKIRIVFKRMVSDFRHPFGYCDPRQGQIAGESILIDFAHGFGNGGIPKPSPGRNQSPAHDDKIGRIILYPGGSRKCIRAECIRRSGKRDVFGGTADGKSVVADRGYALRDTDTRQLRISECTASDLRQAFRQID